MTNTPISINPEFRINLDPLEVLSMLLDALGTSKKMAKEVNEATNFNRSALFASNVCIGLDGLVRQAWSREPPLKKHHIVREIEATNGGKEIVSKPGEWLLDGVWTEEVIPDRVDREEKATPLRIRCAIECESNTSGQSYFEDLSKLLVVSSDAKLFLGGLHQTKRYVRKYMEKRIGQTKSLINKTLHPKHSTDWYLAFWPSPLNKDGKSLWELLDGDFDHLDTINLYHFEDGKFQLVA